MKTKEEILKKRSELFKEMKLKKTSLTRTIELSEQIELIDWILR